MNTSPWVPFRCSTETNHSPTSDFESFQLVSVILDIACDDRESCFKFQITYIFHVNSSFPLN